MIYTFKYYAKFAGKHLYWTFLFDKVVNFSPATYEKETLAHVLYCEFCEPFNNTYSIKHLLTTAS